MAAPGQPMFVRRPGLAAQLLLWVVLALALIVFDARFQALGWLRGGIAGVLYPLQVAVRAPFDFAIDAAEFFTRHVDLKNENRALREKQVRDDALLERINALQAENAELRRLAGLRPTPSHQPLSAEILNMPRDPFSRRVVLDKGANAGFRAGMPVVDADGLAGQVTRVHAMSSEVTLITDGDLVVPAQIRRTGQRLLAFGAGDTMEVRYLPAATDIRPGDVLETSGIDRVYPPGLAVATVLRVQRRGDQPYVRVIAQPAAGVEKSRILLVLKMEAARR